MTHEFSKNTKFSWPKTLVKKWFYNNGKTEELKGSDEYWSNYSESEAYTLKKCKTERLSRSSKIELETDVQKQNYRIFVATWNVGGKSPPTHLNIEDWLHTTPPADIYVLGFAFLSIIFNQHQLRLASFSLSAYSGNLLLLSVFFIRFQEIVPLNAGNVFGTEDNGPARKWLTLIRKTLNNLPSFTENYHIDRGFCDCNRATSRYCLVTSKQMVGIFLSVWIRSYLSHDVRDVKISCVGRGLMGYLRNKGSIAVSMLLHRTSFCFVCSHLTSGEKEGDELRRNSDVVEILRKTVFPRVEGVDDEYSPLTILSHERVIWLGDLNYRVALSYQCAKELVEMRNWKALLQNDQLRKEQRLGRVFEGWREGNICFPPTYKYRKNSDKYAGDEFNQKQKRRTPAWCDRILWYGKGLQQLSYVRGESKFSDHRPVYSVFLTEVVESNHRGRFKKSISYSNARVEVEELLL